MTQVTYEIVDRHARREAEFDAPCVQEHPYFSDGWHDALRGDPLFYDADPIYAEGWRSFWMFREILATIDGADEC